MLRRKALRVEFLLAILVAIDQRIIGTEEGALDYFELGS